MGKKRKKDFLNFDNILEGQILSIDTSLDTRHLFLRHFSANDILNMFRKVGLLHHLNNLGFAEPVLTIDFSSPVHFMKLYNQEKDPRNLLFDLRICEKKYVPEIKHFPPGETPQIYDMIGIEWLSAQNPKAYFKDDRPQLPGQNRPGLGILRYCFKMMILMATEVHKDGFMDVPEHLHGAIMYSKKFKFFDPSHEGVLHALIRDLKKYSLVDISWGIITETIIEQYKQLPQPYKPSEQIFPVSHRLKKYFNSLHYKRIYWKYFRRKRYKFNYDTMTQKREQILKTKKIVDL